MLYHCVLIFTLICLVTVVHSIPPDFHYCQSALRHYGTLRLSLGRASDGKGNKKTKTGDDCSLWYYSGVMRNPTTGKEVVGVEGLESTKVLSSSAMMQDASRTIFSANDRLSLFQNSISYLSSKVFVYTDLYNRSMPIREYRLQTISPKRDVEPVIEMNQLNTIGFRRRRDAPALITENINKKKKKEEASSPKFDFFSVIQWPSGRMIHSNNIHFNKFFGKDSLSPSAVPPSAINSDSLSGRNSLFDQKDSIRVFHFVHGASGDKSVNSSVRSHEPVSLGHDGTENKKESQSRFRLKDWVSVSPSGYQPWHGRSQEQYIIAPQTRASNLRFWVSNLLKNQKQAARARNAAAYLNSDVVMQCTRYGECPSWYAVGKMCTTELTAYKLKDSRELPPHIPSLLASCDMSSFLDRVPKPTRGTANGLNVEEFKQSKDLLQQPRFISWWKKLF